MRFHVGQGTAWREKHRTHELLDGMVQSDLIHQFSRQASFAGSSKSFLYQRLFEILGDWLKDHPDDEISEWLQLQRDRRSEFETSVLLVAAIHREILLDSPGTEKLRDYYPSVGGLKPPTDDDLPSIFLDTVRIKKASQSFCEFMKKANVQTNETGRGIFWLLPVALSGWKEIHLVDLGASAGLNLLANQRKYTLVDKNNVEWSIGQAHSSQFTIDCEPHVPSDLKNSIPNVLSRSGCDLLPFMLESEQDKATLMSFVFADQTDRMERLKEGIVEYERMKEISPIVLMKTNLPDDLPMFLESLGSEKDDAPVVIYNTYMAAYLRDHGRDLKMHIDAWARKRENPVMWAQLEPPTDGNESPNILWCAWTIHLWEKGQPCQQWQIAWSHPHGTRVIWLEDDLKSFMKHFE